MYSNVDGWWRLDFQGFPRGGSRSFVLFFLLITIFFNYLMITSPGHDVIIPWSLQDVLRS